MALTLEAEQRLERVKLTGFYNLKKATWKKLAKETHAFIKRNFPDGATIRRDDVSKALVPLLEVHEGLRDYLNRKKLKQKYWVGDFTDLIVDRVWRAIT